MKSAAFNPAGTLKLMSTFTLVFWSVILIIGTLIKKMLKTATIVIILKISDVLALYIYCYHIKQP